MKIKSLVSAAALCAGLATNASAVSVTNIAGDLYQIDFDPVTFTIGTTSTDGFGVVFEDFFATPATVTGTNVAGSMTITSGGSTIYTSGAIAGFPMGVFPNTVGVFDANDLLVGTTGFPLISVTAGQTVTVSVTGMQFTATDVPAMATGPFDAYLISNFGAALSTTVPVNPSPVPLPAGGALLLTALGIFFAVRRKKAA